MHPIDGRLSRGAGLLVCTALASGLLAGTACAQVDAPPPPAAAAAEPAENNGLAEIVVTAQKREQRLQDVPIAITAITADTVQANRITSVTDLSGFAPNVTVRQSGGSTAIPSFTIRGITSYGVVPGSDKEVSIYVDGVYLGAPRGSTFDLPDIARIEVLRGPQGTLFGRNATAGAISITTRDPTGEFHVRQEVSVGNYDQFRNRTSVDLPAWGPLSAYVTYVHNYKRGDIRNLGAGKVWDRTGPNTSEGVQVSPKYLGTKKSNSIFAAVKFEPSDTFSTVYKYDRTVDRGTPEGNAPIAVVPALLGAAGGAFLNAVLAASPPIVFDTTAKRPKAVNNWWATRSYLRASGHSLTSMLELSDSISLRNIAAYRRSFVYANSQLDGLGGLIYPFPPIAGAPFSVITTNAQSRDKQYSDELQLNYTSDLLTLTTGGLYFHQKGRAGGPPGIRNTFALTPFPGGIIPLGNEATSYNRATSLAAYAQAELHLTSQIDVVGGARITRDKKSGDYVSGGTYVPGPSGGRTDGTFINQRISSFDYKKTKPNFSIGANYKPNADILLFGKYSTAFVSGGSIGGVGFDPETAKSWEAGIKADLFDRRLRANLALFTVRYEHIQSAQSGQNVGRPDLGTVIIDLGNGRAKGFELELSAAPVRGLTLGGGLGYTDIKYSNVSPILLASAGGVYLPTLSPKWTSNMTAQYETLPLFGTARLLLRTDATWRARQRTLSPTQVTVPALRVLEFSNASWIVNSRVALRDISLGPVKGEVALWGRNINNNRATSFPLSFGFAAASTFQAARTYGADFIVNF